MYMVVIIIESLIGIVLFTAVIVSLTLKNPLTSGSAIQRKPGFPEQRI
jgi:hypothetical protein